MAHHVIDTSTSIGNLLQNAINHLRAAQDNMKRVHSLMDNARGAPANYALIEGGAFGIAAGEGEAVFTLVASVNGELQGLTEGFVSPIDQGG